MKSFSAIIKIICLCLLANTGLHAQNEPYHGGSGAGMLYTTSSIVSCNAMIYAGGSGGGETKIASAQTECMLARFAGGSGDGDSAVVSSLLACNVSRFSGDTADGIGYEQSNLLSCNRSRFAGDTADGFAIVASNLLNCNLFRFAGDTGAGYKSAIYLKPRNFLGNDTSITIICSEERFNLLGLYNFNGIAIAWNTPHPDTVFTGNYRAIGTTAGGCVDTAFALVKQNIAIWGGTVNSDWHTAANWSNNEIPGATTHVIIPGGTPNPCIISNADAQAVSVQGKINGSFFITNNKNLLISGRCVQLPSGQ